MLFLSPPWKFTLYKSERRKHDMWFLACRIIRVKITTQADTSDEM